MSGVQTAIGLVFIAVGALFCFAGWPLYKMVVAISGFLTGSVVGAFIGEYLVRQPPSYGSGSDLAVLLIALVTGIVAAWLAVKLIKAVAFLFGFAYFTTGTALVMELQGMDQNTTLVVALVMGVLGGILAIVALRFSVTLSTAFAGAFLITLGAQEFGLISNGDMALVVILALAVLGFATQYGIGTSTEPAQATAHQTSAAHFTNATLIPGSTLPPPDAAEERFCPDCGIQLSAADTQFCRQCGATLP